MKTIEEILGGMVTHIEILERAHGDHFSVQRLRALHDDLMAAHLEERLKSSIFMIERRKCLEVGGTVVPFPGNIDIHVSDHTLKVTKRSMDAHLGAEGA